MKRLVGYKVQQKLKLKRNQIDTGNIAWRGGGGGVGGERERATKKIALNCFP